METLLKDLRFGVRSLLKRPTFSALAVLTLALGIGACTAVFSIVDGVLLRALPYPQAERMVQLREINSRGGQMAFAEPNFLDVRARTHTLEALAQYSGGLETITGGAEPVRALTYNVSSDFFKVIGAQPIVGRTFSGAEVNAAMQPVAVVSYGFWQRLLGGRPDLNGTTLRISDKTFSVIGVMPQGLSFPSRAEVWIPRELYPAQISRSAHNWSVIGRLRPNVNVEQARADLNVIAKQLKDENGEKMDGIGMTLFTQQEYTVGSVRSILLIITVAVAFLLAVACANVANLLLAQATARRREFAVRAALGASRLRLARQFMIENLVIALIAGSLGSLFSFWGVALLIGLNQRSLPRTAEIHVDLRTLAFALGVSTFVAVVLGLVPLLRFSARDLEAELREGGRSLSGGRGARARGVLVATQMALTFILLIGAGLLGKSFYRLLHIDPGFNTESAVAMEISMPGIETDEKQYRQLIKSYEQLMRGEAVSDVTPPYNAQEEKQRLFHQEMIDRITHLPGVTAAGTINALPLAGDAGDGTFMIDNNPNTTGHAEYRVATAGYFTAMGIPLLRGRTFDASDQPTAPHAALISQSLAQKYWPNEDPIGRQIQFGNMDGDLRLLHIVGVVGDVHDRGVDINVKPTLYGNAYQRPAFSSVSVVVRAQVPAESLSPALRETIRSLNPNLPVSLRTLNEVFSSSLDQQRFSLVIFGVFAAVALLLAVMGIYGVTTYSVTQRTQEIGIRMALGARLQDVLRLVLSNGMKLVLIGEVIGLAGAFALTRLMRGLLFEVTPTDTMTFVIVSGVLTFVALVACYLPARRATKVDPLVALRYE